MDHRQIEEIFNETFPGLTFFYRDVNLPSDLISSYHIGQIIMERGMTDMTHKGGGLGTNFRYLIATSKAADLSAFNPDAALTGQAVLNANAWFKVLDIYWIESRTQVFLLNIPERGIELFKNATSNVEESIVLRARQNFEEKIRMPPIEALQTKNWRERTSYPLGMNDKGELFFQDDSQDGKTLVRGRNRKTGSASPGQKRSWWQLWRPATVR
jgi:hypothetical protein